MNGHDTGDKVLKDQRSELLLSQREQADKFAFPMFCLSLLFLVLLAALIVAWVDIPRVVELAQAEAIEAQAGTERAGGDDGGKEGVNNGAALATPQPFLLTGGLSGTTVAWAEKLGSIFLVLLCLLWPLFVIEYVLSVGRWQFGRTPLFDAESLPRKLARASVCLVPPLRLAAQSPAWDNRIWLPVLNWQHPGRQLSKTLEQIASKPMLIIALLILPVLLIEFGLSGLIEKHGWLRVLLHVSTGFIWWAFTVEFIIMISATDKKLNYVKKHWIDLAIILLPLLSFLRSIRVLRIAKLAKVQKVAKMGRIYRMRGLAMKVFKAMAVAGLVQRVLKVTPEKRLQKLKLQYKEKTEELADLQEDIDELEAEIKLTSAESKNLVGDATDDSEKERYESNQPGDQKRSA